MKGNETNRVVAAWLANEFVRIYRERGEVWRVEKQGWFEDYMAGKYDLTEEKRRVVETTTAPAINKETVGCCYRK